MMAQSASKSCDICMGGSGHNYCEQCEQWMCENCKTLHLRSKICRNHSFLSGSKIVPEESPFCKKHDENFIFYCVDCDIPICKICIVKNHKRHDTSDINESTKELQAEVKNVVDSKIKSVKTILDKIEQGTGRYQKVVNEAIRTVTEEGKQMKQWIDKKVQALISSLQEKETTMLLALQSANTDFQNYMEKLKKCQNFFTDSQKIGDPTKRLKKLKDIKLEIDVAVEKQSPIMPTIKYNKKNVSEQEIISLFGNISIQEICYSIEKTPKRGTSEEHISEEHSIKTLYRYQCNSCGEEKLSERNPTRFLRWFFLKE